MIAMHAHIHIYTDWKMNEKLKKKMKNMTEDRYAHIVKPLSNTMAIHISIFGSQCENELYAEREWNLKSQLKLKYTQLQINENSPICIGRIYEQK